MRGSWPSIVVLAGCVAACSSGEEESLGRISSGGAPDASVAWVPPCEGGVCPVPHERVTLRLGPVIGLQANETGWADAIEEIDGARVCVNRWRPKGSTEWAQILTERDDYEEAYCDHPGAAMQPVLEVWADAELVITADADGWTPSAFAVLVGDVDLDFASLGNAWTANTLTLVPKEGPFPWLRPGRQIVEERFGSIGAFALTSRDGTLYPPGGIWNVAGLRGATFSLRESVGEGPDYAMDGLYDPDLKSTEGRALDPTYQPARPSEGRYENLAEGTIPFGHIWTTATFSRVPPGEYHLEAHHPRATCELTAYQIRQPINGFMHEENVIRVPVLEGHATLLAGFWCACDASRSFDLPEYSDPLACEVGPRDAAAD